ncbi:MAG: amino acid adenylation protein, partial [Actinobacteria bacterium]|nr:amino acid adenylation protein [Actinomycetota bacterium]
GWLRVDPIEVGSRTFLGNTSLLRGDTRVGDDCLIGVLSTAPESTPSGTSWLGCPALELPRIPEEADPARTTDPPRRLVVARGAIELLRLLLPAVVSTILAALVLFTLDSIGRSTHSVVAMLAAAPLAILAAGICALAFTVLAKWLVIGRYRPSEHPLWSWFVWRDELMNSLQTQLAGAWLLGSLLGTPMISTYLRAMGARVGRDVWLETNAITEFDVIDIGDGCAINRTACIETHLFHDRLLRIGPSELGACTTLGPTSIVLPDTKVGAGCTIGGRSLVLRGEELPDGTCWHGSPVVPG